MSIRKKLGKLIVKGLTIQDKIIRKIGIEF